jgi:hypothetical protein
MNWASMYTRKEVRHLMATTKKAAAKKPAKKKK